MVSVRSRHNLLVYFLSLVFILIPIFNVSPRRRYVRVLPCDPPYHPRYNPTRTPSKRCSSSTTVQNGLPFDRCGRTMSIGSCLTRMEEGSQRCLSTVATLLVNCYPWNTDHRSPIIIPFLQDWDTISVPVPRTQVQEICAAKNIRTK